MRVRFPLSIFSRLVLGYLAIFVFLAATCLYTIFSMGEFTEVTHSLLNNNLTIDSIGKLTETLLSQVRHEKKFIITKDLAFYGQFIRLSYDFEHSADEVLRTTDSIQIRRSLVLAQDSYKKYQALFEEEVGNLKNGRRYLPEWYTTEKDRVVNGIIDQLEKIKLYNQQDINRKIQELYQAGAHAQRMSIMMTGGFLVFSIILSFFIQRSITHPISVMKRKTREIATGHFGGDLALSSPPELEELARDLNFMCSKLQELDKMKSDFFFSVSHELRTPLSTIKMGLRLLSDIPEEMSGDKRKKLVATLDEEIARVLGVVDSLLDLAKMEAGMMAYTLEEKDLSPLIDRAIAELEPLAEAKRIRLGKAPVPTLPSVRIDAERILQVLRNLIGNALKFTPRGGEVKVSVRSFDGGIQVAVKDTGAGVPPEDLSTIFEKFQRGTLQKNYPVKGTGLGLALVKEIITAHGGRVWAESAPQEGSTFIFILPQLTFSAPSRVRRDSNN
jgi:two-component system, NtrC family, sensor histidine kinase GlrK